MTHRLAPVSVAVGAVALVGVAAYVALAWLGDSPGIVQTTATVRVAQVEEAEERAERVRVDPASLESGDAPVSAVRLWAAGVCGSGEVARHDDGTPVEWWELPLADVMAALLYAIEQDDLEWSAVGALEKIQEIGYLAAPWAEEVSTALREPRLRESAAVALAALGPDALVVLEKAATDDDPGVRQGALRALAEATYRRRAIVEIAVVALEDPDPDVRLAAIEVLAVHDDAPEVSVVALSALVASEDDATQREVMEALERNGPAAAAAVPALMAVVGDARAPRAADALAALVSIGPAAAPAVQTLLSVLLAQPRVYERSIPDAIATIAPDAYLAALSDERDDVRERLAERAELVVDHHPAREEEVLRALRGLESDRAPGVRAAAARTRTSIVRERESLAKELASLLADLDESRDAEPDDRVSALLDIDELGPRARPLAANVRELLADADDQVRVVAAFTVWDIDPPARDVLPILESYRTHPDLGWTVYIGLRDRPPPSWAEHLVGVLRDPATESEVWSEVHGLVETLGAAALEALVRWAKEETQPDRIVVVATLLAAVGPAAEPALRDLASQSTLPAPLRSGLLRLAEEAR